MQSGKGLISGSQRNINHLLGVEIQGKNWGKESGSVKHLWPMYRYFHLVTAHEPQVFKGSWEGIKMCLNFWKNLCSAIYIFFLY